MIWGQVRATSAGPRPEVELELVILRAGGLKNVA